MWIIREISKIMEESIERGWGSFQQIKKKELLSFFLELGFALKSKLVAVVVVKQWIES